jgi:hypothetical protein
MNWKGIFPGILILLLVLLFITPGCKTCEDNNPHASGTLVNYQGCKSVGNQTARDQSEIPSNKDCIEYSYDGQTLFLKHINSAFNCCPGEISADIHIDGNMITISENEKEAGCLCLCLFDLEYKISNLEPGEYTIFINQLYLEDNDQVLEFTLQLCSGTSGTFCLIRTHYPWGN